MRRALLRAVLTIVLLRYAPPGQHPVNFATLTAEQARRLEGRWCLDRVVLESELEPWWHGYRCADCRCDPNVWGDVCLDDGEDDEDVPTRQVVEAQLRIVHHPARYWFKPFTEYRLEHAHRIRPD